MKMEMNGMFLTCCLVAFLSLISCVVSMPLDSSNDIHLEEKRPKYMDTRDLDFFQELVYVSLQKLAQENKINKFVLASMPEDEDIEPEAEAKDDDESIDKRGRHLRLCLRRIGKSYRPYPCWRHG